MTDETKTLTEDEQFAAAVKGNPLFDGMPEESPAAGDDAGAGDDDGAAAGEAAAAGEGADADDAGNTADDEGTASGDDATAQAAAGDPAGDGTADAPAANADDGQAAAAAEPFPGYNALPAEAREAFDKLANERKKYESDYKALYGMTGPLQRQNADLRRQHDAQVARIQQMEQLERKQQDVSAAKDKAIQEFDEWAKQFPEESRAVLAMVNPLREKVTALEGSLNAARAELGNLHAERQQAALAREIGELERVHPDWRAVHDSPEYWEWLNRQTPGIQGLNGSMFAGDTIQLLNLFKSGRTPAKPDPTPTPTPQPSATADRVQQRRGPALARGTQPNVRSTESPVTTAGSPSGMSDEDAEFARLVADNPNFR
jgi:hypothetical protein